MACEYYNLWSAVINNRPFDGLSTFTGWVSAFFIEYWIDTELNKSCVYPINSHSQCPYLTKDALRLPNRNVSHLPGKEGLTVKADVSIGGDR